MCITINHSRDPRTFGRVRGHEIKHKKIEAMNNKYIARFLLNGRYNELTVIAKDATEAESYLEDCNVNDFDLEIISLTNLGPTDLPKREIVVEYC